MYNYNNPCGCSNLVDTNAPVSRCDGECIHLPHMLLLGEESIGPCNEIKSILWDKCLDLCTCEKYGETPVFSTYATENLVVTNIDADGIEMRSDGGPNAKEGYIQFIVKCGHLSGIGTITVVFINKCKNVNCTSGMQCDKCTGNCVPLGADLDVT